MKPVEGVSDILGVLGGVGRAWATALLLGAAGLAVSCNGGTEQSALNLAAALDSSTNPPVLRLSHSPNDLAARSTGEFVVEPDLVLGGGDRGFGAVADVAELADGRIAVLDPMLHEIRIYDLDGTLIRSFGRKGQGPTEFGIPLALEALNEALVVWQAPAARALQILTYDGAPIATAAAPVPGDWDQMARRSPAVVGPVTRGPQDAAFRLGVMRDELLVLIQPDESLALQDPSRAFPWDRPPMHVLRVGLDLGVRDTLLTLRGAPLRSKVADAVIPSSGSRGLLRVSEEDHLGPRALIAAGHDWVAAANGDEAVITVLNDGGDSVFQIVWPESGLSVSEQHKYEAARWLLAYQLVSSQSAEGTEQLGKREIQGPIRILQRIGIGRVRVRRKTGSLPSGGAVRGSRRA